MKKFKIGDEVYFYVIYGENQDSYFISKGVVKSLKITLNKVKREVPSDGLNPPAIITAYSTANIQGYEIINLESTEV